MKHLLALKFSPKLDRPSPGCRGCHIGHSFPDLTVVIMQRTVRYYYASDLYYCLEFDIFIETRSLPTLLTCWL